MAWSKSHPGERSLVEAPVAAHGLQPQHGSWVFMEGWQQQGQENLWKRVSFSLNKPGVVGLGWVVGSVPAG